MNKMVKNDLFDYSNRYIYQSGENFRFSLDSILLAEFVNVSKPNLNILDLCTGNAPIPLILSTYTKSEIVGFELQKDICDLANLSITYNQLNKQIKIINDDVKNINKYYQKNYFDIITCNPPYFKYDNNDNINENKTLAIARHEIYLSLEDIFMISSQYLKDNGKFFLIHRCTRLDEIIILANKYKINVKEIQLISTNNDNKPSLVLVKCVKNSKNNVIINKIINVNNLKTYKDLFRK